MTVTTIKVPSELRDVLKQQARGHGRTLSAHLQALALAETRRQRAEAMKIAMEENPPDDEYFAETEEWLGAGWS